MGTGRQLHPSQVHRALRPPAALLGSLVDLDDDVASIVVIGTAEVLTVSVIDQRRLGAALARDDLTLTPRGALVLCSPSYQVLAVATGPQVAPAQVHCAWSVVRIDKGEAVEVPAAHDGQPDWQLFACFPSP